MLITIFFVTLLALLSSPGAVRAGGLSVQTPAFVQCQTAQISWDSTLSPYDVLIANQSDQCGYAVGDIGQVVNNSIDWIVALPGGWTVVITVEDALTDDCWSQPITVQPSNDTSCLSPDLAAIAPIDDAEYSSTHTSTATTLQKPSGKSGAGTTSVAGGFHNAAASFHRRVPPLPAVLVGVISVAASAFFSLQINTP